MRGSLPHRTEILLVKTFLQLLAVLTAFSVAAQSRSARTNTNLALQSQTFANATWSKGAGTVTATDNVLVAPDGTTTGASLVENGTTNSTRRVLQSAIALAASTTYTASVYAQPGTLAPGKLVLFLFETAGQAEQSTATWDITTGNVTGTATVGGNTATANPSVVMPNGWRRYSITFTTGTTTFGDWTFDICPTNVDNLCQHVGVVGATTYLWGAQLELGSAAGPYVATTSASATGRAAVAKGNFFPMNRSGADLCSEFSTTITGTNSWCLKPDGTSMSGGLTLSATGSPTTVDAPFYPNGVDKGPGQAQQFTTADAWNTASVAAPTGNASACVVAEVNDPTASTALISHGSNLVSDANLSFGITTSNASGLQGFVSNGTTDTTITSSTVLIARAWHFVCFTYAFVGDGTSTLTLYLDGAQTAQSTTAKAPNNASFKWNVNGTSGGSRFAGQARNGFFTPQTLSAATIAKMARAVFGGRGLSNLPLAATDTPTYEIPVTTTRSSAARFVVPSTSGDRLVPVGNNVPRVTPNGVQVEQTRTSLILRSEAFDNASWSKVGVGAAAPVVTADTTDVTDPLGGNTAEKVVYPAVASPNASVLQQAYTATAAAYSDSVWARTLNGTATICLETFTGGTTVSTNCTFGSVWTRCKLENVTKTAASWTLDIGNDRSGGAGGCSTDTAAATVYLWGAQGELGIDTSGYIPTTTTSVARSAESVVGTVSVAPKCVSVTWNTPSLLRSDAFLNRWLTATTDCSSASMVDAYVPTGGTAAPLSCIVYTSGTQRVGTSASNFVTPNSTLRARCTLPSSTTIATCSGSTCENTTISSFTPISVTSLYIGGYCNTAYAGEGTFQGALIGPASGDCN